MGLFVSEFGGTPGRSAVGGDLDFRDVRFTRPGSSVNRYFASLDLSPFAGTGDHGLNIQRGHNVRIFRLHRISRLSGLVGEAIARTHEVALKLLFEHFDLGEPFARCGANPARYERARRTSVMLGQRGSIHVCGDQSVGIERLFNGDAADKGWNFAGNVIEPTEHYVLSRSLHSPTLQ